MSIVSEPDWEGVRDELLELRGVAILLGTTDCGKSTLARHLIRELINRRLTAALVDADIGQSALGLPGTVSLKSFRTPAELESFRYDRMSFVGTVNPAHIISLLVAATGRMTALARRTADITLIDTTGLVAGNLGKALKLAKIREVRPELVIAIQHRDELEHILPLLEIPVRLLKPSPMARTRSPEARAAYRRRRLADYFARSASTEFLVSVRDAAFVYRSRPAILSETHAEPGTLIGLNHQEDTLALGIVGELDDVSVAFRSPLTTLRWVNRVVLGDFKAG